MKKRIFLPALLLTSALAAAIILTPWTTILENKIAQALQEQGLENVTLTLDRISLSKATFSSISIGSSDPLQLSSITIEYTPEDLLDGNLQDLTLSGLSVQLQEKGDGWKVGGINTPSIENDGNDEPLKSPLIFADIIDLLPVSSIKIKDSQLLISSSALQTSLPLELHLTKTPQTTIDLTINAANLTAAASDISLGVVTIHATPDENRSWNGTWTAESIDFGETLPIPVLKGEGTLNSTESITTINGELASADQSHKTEFSLLLNTEKGDTNALTIKSASLPFKGGRVSARNTIIPFDRSKNIQINLSASKLSLDELMQTLTGQRVSATGTVSGSIPVILHPDGSYTLGKGSLKADNEGTLHMSESLIPGNHEQVQLVREILENLHYSSFNATVDTSDKNGLIVRLSLEGKNPLVSDGRPVKLNVNLTGDILDFIQQNATLITNPEKLLRQGIYE